MPRKHITVGQRSYALDARPDRLDLRDRPFLPKLGNLPSEYPSDEIIAEWLPKYSHAKLILDQGPDGACTGFGLAAVINYLLFVNTVTSSAAPRHVSPAMLYELAKLYDEWPGEDYEGSSCRGALKGWHRHGVCRDALWPYTIKRGKRIFVTPAEDPQRRADANRNWDIDALQTILGVYYRVDSRSIVDMQAALVETGALYVSGTAHEGWDVKSRVKLDGHSDLVRLRHVPKPTDAGGHAFALVGYNDWGFVVQNSWGTEWASRGFAVLPYEDWVAHGEDAWVLTLGASRKSVVAGHTGQDRHVRSPRFFIPYSDLVHEVAPDRPAGLIAADDAIARESCDVPVDVRPLEPDHAYRHTVVLDRGFPVRNDITAENPSGSIANAVVTRPATWMRDNKTNKLLIYAHGGLNSESASLSRIRAIAPYALHAGIYPLFITWRSGSVESVSDLVEESFASLGFGVRAPARGWADRITDKTDRMLETMMRGPGAALWGQMKLNAVRASEHDNGGVRLMVDCLRELAKQRPKLEIHLIGHSAGAILLGAMLPLLRRARLAASSVRLFAPACTTGFALEQYKPAVAAGTIDPKHWYIHVLSDENEKDDSVGPYRKSLLYLVSRSFEDAHKMPILGLDASFDATTAAPGAGDDQWNPQHLTEVRNWVDFWDALGIDDTHRIVLTKSSVSTGRTSIRSSHGCFDNAVDIMGDALGYIVSPSAPKRVRIYKLDY